MRVRLLACPPASLCSIEPELLIGCLPGEAFLTRKSCSAGAGAMSICKWIESELARPVQRERLQKRVTHHEGNDAGFSIGFFRLSACMRWPPDFYYRLVHQRLGDRPELDLDLKGTELNCIGTRCCICVGVVSLGTD